ncbi:MAG: hypothetical protein ACLQPH_05055 [Acidimicrobiales bacterium]
MTEFQDTVERPDDEVERLRREVAKLHAGDDRLRREKAVLRQLLWDAAAELDNLVADLGVWAEKGPDEVAWTQVGHGGREVIDVTVRSSAGFTAQHLQKHLASENVEHWLSVARSEDPKAVLLADGRREPLPGMGPTLNIGEKAMVDVIENGPTMVTDLLSEEKIPGWGDTSRSVQYYVVLMGSFKRGPWGVRDRLDEGWGSESFTTEAEAKAEAAKLNEAQS